MMKRGKQLIGMALIIIMAFIFATCAEAEDSVIYSDIIAGIDYDSVTVDGDATFFSSVMSDGTVVRFEGKNISIDADGVTLKPESTVTSLDAVGAIYVYQVSVKDGKQSPVREQWLDIGYGYTNSADKISVGRANDVYADALMGYSVAVWNDDVSLSIADIEPNFVFIKSTSGNTTDITVTSLTIGYNPSQKFTNIEVARSALPDHFVNFEAFFETADTVYEEEHEKEYPESYEEAYENTDPVEIEKLSENVLDKSKTAESSVIYSDIIAGIDYDSVAVDGDATFFSSVMSDGTEIRFEGTNISIDADGVTLKPESTVTSLDAVGTIYVYQASVKDGEEEPVREQYLDVGYGYTLSPDLVNMGRASDIFRSACYTYPSFVWNQGGSISLDDYRPNFVFVSSMSANTEEITLTSLVIGYDPTEKYTDVETLRETIPDYVYDELQVEVDVIENVPGTEAVEESFININTLAEMRMEEPGAIYSDVIAGIDHDSIRVDGKSTFFSSVMSDGAVVRFEGTNVTIEEEGLTLSPESRVVSLDAVGRIYLYRAMVKDGTNASACDQWLSVGGGYTFEPEKTSVERAGEVFANGTSGFPASDWNNDCMASMIGYEPNFVFFNAQDANSTTLTLTGLIIGYQPNEKYTAITEIEGYLPDYYYTQTSVTPSIKTEALQTSAETEYDGGEMSEGDVTDIEMAKPGAMTSDIIAGIDYDSISVDGDVTFFSSVMSDGAVVRFEGKHISITDEGITMNLNGSVTSLDAVGKIYEYSGAIKDKDEAYANDQWISIGYGYTFSADKISVERASEVFTHSLYLQQVSTLSPELTVSVASYEPNFVYVETADYNTAEFTLTSLTIGYNPAEKVTAITDLELYAYRYGYYMEGEPYDYAKEDKADEEVGEYDFYLQLKLEVLDECGIDDRGYNENWMWFLPNDFYEVGDLKDADGNVLDKETARIHEGYTLDVSVGDYDFTLELPMAELYTGAQTLKEARPYSTLTAVGEQNALVVPVVWTDQTDLVSDELYALYQKELGRLIDAQGNPIGDFSDANDEVFSLTEYFDAASYGQLKLSSFMTDWYYTDKTFAGDYEYVFPEIDFADEVLRWVKATYPDTDWTQFDRDGDGTVDAIVFISVGLSQDESYMPASFGGAVHSTGNSYGKLAGTREDPQANCFLTVNHSFLMDGKINTLIHEFSHNFGLNDYYDTSYSGIDAVGGYDMEGSNVGDWNAYSKLAAGWIEPQIVSGLASGESVELTIGSLALTDDVIILPAAGAQYDGPFGEYVTIDLLSPDGANVYDAAEYGLENTVGVRISHVNANMRSVTESDGVLGEIEDNGNAIGMELHSNSYDETFGIYNIEVIQSGGENTFTNLENLMPTLRAEDLFYEGDTFTAAAYDQFFYHGLMDNGMELGYRVDILSIGTNAEGNPTATIRITAD